VYAVDAASGGYSSWAYSTGSINPAAFNPATDLFYLSGDASATPPYLDILAPEILQSLPLTSTIAPQPFNQTGSSATFQFTTSSRYTPAVPAVQQVYYQLDTWQGPWLKASGTAPNFSANLSGMIAGQHVLYAYATDAQEGDSIQPGASGAGQSSPNMGSIAAYTFLVAPKLATSQISASSSPNGSLSAQPITYTATVSGAGPAPTGSVSFSENGCTPCAGTTFDNITLGSVPLDSSSHATISSSAILPVGQVFITAGYSGDANYLPSTTTFTQNVSPAPTRISIALTGGSNPSTAGQAVTFTATVQTSPGITINGDVQFMDGSSALGAPAAISNGTASLTISSLTAGTHTITAQCECGGLPFPAAVTQSTSPAITQVVATGGSTASSTAVSVNGASTGSIHFGAAGTGQVANLSVQVSPASATGSVVLLDGNRQLGPALPLSGGTASYTTQLGVGEHTIRAIYLGNGTVAGSGSPTVTVQRSPWPGPR
jgi:hypothetical protein